MYKIYLYELINLLKYRLEIKQNNIKNQLILDSTKSLSINKESVVIILNLWKKFTKLLSVKVVLFILIFIRDPP